MTKQKYKLETWNKTKYKGQKREEKTTVKRLVKRDSNGHFAKNTPIITKIHIKVYGSGVYQVGYINDKIVTRHKIAEKNIEWYNAKKEHDTNTKLYRTSYVLNNVPISKNGYYGFRIVVFSTNEQKLKDIKPKMKQRLIKWIEDCINYEEDDFWFDMYFGYEAPSLANASKNENNNYYLTQENSKGMIIKEKNGQLREIR
jgi:hypothetical protein